MPAAVKRVETASRAAPSPVAPRLLAGLRPERAIRLGEHLSLHGELVTPSRRESGRLLELVAASGLRGRGGSGFPTAAKMKAVIAQKRRPVVLVNATEGEPVSGKDKVLLRHAPHLVLDGAVVAARIVGARDVIVGISETAAPELASVGDALAERHRVADDAGVRIRVSLVPDGFVTGEESALVRAVAGEKPVPSTKPPLPFERGVRGAPTLVQNAETLAHLGLIARHGPRWFRMVGTPAEPGSMLVTVSGAVGSPGVLEVPVGTPLVEIVAQAGGVTEQPQAMLIGGYFGTWVAASDARRLTMSAEALRAVGAAPGAGAVVVFPSSACGIRETSRVAGYLARESAGQCGPCMHGLAAVAGALDRLAEGGPAAGNDRLARWLTEIPGRGACKHPDGATHFVGSALRVFAADLHEHVRRGGCRRRSSFSLPVGAGYSS